VTDVTFLDTQLTKFRRTKSPAVHVGEVTLLIRTTGLTVVVVVVVVTVVVVVVDAVVVGAILYKLLV